MYTSTLSLDILVRGPVKAHYKPHFLLIHVKGPVSRAASHFWDCWSMLGGDSHIDTQKLHEAYGPVVRIMPDALSFTTAQAWKGTASPQRGMSGAQR